MLVPRLQTRRVSRQNGVPGAVTFARTGTTAYDSAGGSYAASVPRFDSGKGYQGPGAGLLIEEATTNLLTANQASVEVDTTGFAAVASATLTRDTTTAWTGAASLKVVTPNVAAGEGASVSISATNAQKYTATAWVKAASGTPTVRFQASGAATANGTTVTLSASVYTRVSLSVTAGSTASLVFALVTNVQQAATFYADGLQVENKGYATTWCAGATTRNAELCTAPMGGLFRLAGGCVVARAYCDGDVTSATVVAVHRIVDILDGTSGVGIIKLSGSNQWRVHVSGGTQTNVVFGSTTPVGWHALAVAWTSSLVVFALDGVIVATAVPTDLPTFTQAGTLAIGSSTASSQHWDGAIGEVTVLPYCPSQSDVATLTANPNAPLPHLPGASLYLPFSRGNLQAYGRNLSAGDRLNLHGTSAYR